MGVLSCFRVESDVLVDGSNLLSLDGTHVVIQVGDLIFDNANPNAIPFDKWKQSFGGSGVIGPAGSPTWIEYLPEEFRSPSRCGGRLGMSK